MRSIKTLSVLLGIMFLTASAFGQQAKSDEGIDLYRAGNFSDAVLRLTEATSLDRSDGQAWLYLAAAHKHLGNDKEAIKAIKSSRSSKKTIPPKYDKPVKITSKRTPGVRGEYTGGRSDYAVAIELCSDGTVGIIIPYMTSFFERQQEIIDDAKKIKFEPAEQNGKPVTVIYVFEYTFSSTNY